MFHFDHVGTDRETERELYVLELAAPDELPRPLVFPSRYSTVLIVWDARGVSAGGISRFARDLIDAGVVYFCTWGPDCERVHDLIDEAWVGDGSTPASDSTLMTTWHNDSLAEALWFSIYNALPNDAFYEECRSVIAICIDSPREAEECRVAFADTERFSEELLGRNEE